MYSKKNIKTYVNLNLDNLPSEFDPTDFFEKKTNLINEKYKDDAFDQTKVILGTYAINEKENIGILTCRNVSHKEDNNLIMCMLTEENAKKIMPRIHNLVNSTTKISELEMLSHFIIGTDEGQDQSMDEDDSMQIVVSSDFRDNFSEDEINDKIREVIRNFEKEKNIAVSEYTIMNFRKNDKEFGAFVVHDENTISQLILGTYQESIAIQKEYKNLLSDGFSISLNNYNSFLERCETKKKLRKKKRNERRRKRR